MFTPLPSAPHTTGEAIPWWRCLPRVALVQWHRVPRPARQVCVAVVGTAVLLVGVALIVLPGPAVLVIPLGFAILATEFPWARRLLDWAKDRLLRLKRVALANLRARGRRSPTPA
jgi:uncharacterized protein (TIGR02611 family)